MKIRDDDSKTKLQYNKKCTFFPAAHVTDGSKLNHIFIAHLYIHMYECLTDDKLLKGHHRPMKPPKADVF